MHGGITLIVYKETRWRAFSFSRNDPLKKEVQEDGRTRYWAFVSELDRIVRVVILEDGETIHNAFMDRSFKK